MAISFTAPAYAMSTATTTAGASIQAASGSQVNLNVGDQILIGVSFDNLTGTTPTVSSISLSAGAGTVTIVNGTAAANPTTAAGSVRTALALVTITTGNSNILFTANLSGSVGAKAIVARGISGAATTGLTHYLSAAVSGTTISQAPTGNAGDFGVVAFGNENNTVPVDDGAGHLSVASASGGAASNTGVTLAWQVAGTVINGTITGDGYATYATLAQASLAGDATSAITATITAAGAATALDVLPIIVMPPRRP